MGLGYDLGIDFVAGDLDEDVLGGGEREEWETRKWSLGDSSIERLVGSMHGVVSSSRMSRTTVK